MTKLCLDSRCSIESFSLSSAAIGLEVWYISEDCDGCDDCDVCDSDDCDDCDASESFFKLTAVILE